METDTKGMSYLEELCRTGRNSCIGLSNDKDFIRNLHTWRDRLKVPEPTSQGI